MKQLTHNLIVSIVLSLVACPLMANTADRDDVQHFIQFMHQQHNFDSDKLTQLFNTIPQQAPQKAKHEKHGVIHEMQSKHDFVPWYQYRPIFIKSDTIQAGAQFWYNNRHWLNKAQTRFGVPASVIVATIGIETHYGEQLGTHPIFKSLSVLTFDYPHRHDFFRQQLIAFLLYCRDNGFDPKTLKGSYAGALGQPQFMPTSIRDLAIDFDDTDKIDLYHDSADAIGSVAHYYAEHGWQPGKPIATKALIRNHQQLKDLLNKTSHPKMTLRQFKKHGIDPRMKLDQDLKANLVKLKGENHPIYWLTFHNFDVIKTYNSSTDYAMALYQLSHKLVYAYREHLDQLGERS